MFKKKKQLSRQGNKDIFLAEFTHNTFIFIDLCHILALLTAVWIQRDKGIENKWEDINTDRW